MTGSAQRPPETADLTESELQRLADALYGRGRATGRYLRCPVRDAVEQIVAYRVRSTVGDLVPGLRAEAARLRGIKVVSVALWMDAEADRLERICPPGGAS